MSKYKTIIEPFKIKSVEPLGFTSEVERKEILKKACFNLFKVPADKVLIDLLTDSGTGAMSSEQWAAIMRGDESYAGAKSFFSFEKAVKDITGYKEIIPTHQGRAAERILFSIVGGEGKIFLSNSHFDTTRANVEYTGAKAIDFPVKEALDFELDYTFKGNIDLKALEDFINGPYGKSVAMVILTVTNNSMGGQPVSMQNIRETSALCKKHKIPMFIDCARFAENSYFIKLREKGYENKTPLEIAKEMFSYGDGCLMSAKKDAIVNIGGFLALNDSNLAEKAKQVEILGEGFPTYGGLAGRDLEAIACGLYEALDEEYLKYRITSISYFGEGLKRHGIPIVEPPGGHAIYVNAKKFLSHIPACEFPGHALACELYLEAGIRACEIGSLMFGKHNNGKFIPAQMELLRLAVPRRVYTQSHIDYVIEAFGFIARRKEEIKGYKILEASSVLAHFTAKLAPV